MFLNIYAILLAQCAVGWVRRHHDHGECLASDLFVPADRNKWLGSRASSALSCRRRLPSAPAF
jgi:hypothetical protein